MAFSGPEGTNGSNGNGSVETWSGRGFKYEDDGVVRRAQVLVTQGNVGVAIDHLLGKEESRPILDSAGKPTGKERFGRELSEALLDRFATVGDFTIAADPDNAEAVEAMRRLEASDITWVRNLQDIIPPAPGMEVQTPQTPRIQDVGGGALAGVL